MTWLYLINEFAQWLFIGYLVWVIFLHSDRTDRLFTAFTVINRDIIKVLQKDFVMRHNQTLEAKAFHDHKI